MKCCRKRNKNYSQSGENVARVRYGSPQFDRLSTYLIGDIICQPINNFKTKVSLLQD